MTALPLHAFRDKARAILALTHKSFGAPHNEKLEWLGDALLEYHISLAIYRRFPDLDEGGWSTVRTHLVNTDKLAELAIKINLPAHLKLGKAEIPSGYDNPRLLAGALEAYFAAIHLDGGPLEKIIADLYADEYAQLEEKIKRFGVRVLSNPKTLLQEYAHRHCQSAPQYRLIKTTGKPHQRLFYVECRVTPTCAHTRAGKTRAKAEQNAALQCLQDLSAARP